MINRDDNIDLHDYSSFPYLVYTSVPDVDNPEHTHGDFVPSGTVIGSWELTRSMELAHFAHFLDDYLNAGGKQFPEGNRIGKWLCNTHRTLQRQAITFCLGIICGLSEQEYTDLRNAKAVECAKKIKEMIENGELNYGGYV